MKLKRLYLRLTSDEIVHAANRYHFGDQMIFFQKVYERVVKCINPVLYYEYDYPEKNQVTAIISLGNGPDRMMENCQEREDFLEAYAVECLGLELLSCSYEQFKELIHRERRQFMNAMQFWDADELAIMLPLLQKKWGELPVSMNEAYALLPSKSVIFYGILEEFSQCTQHLCSHCRHKNCIFRTTTGDDYDI